MIFKKTSSDQEIILEIEAMIVCSVSVSTAERFVDANNSSASNIGSFIPWYRRQNELRRAYTKLSFLMPRLCRSSCIYLHRGSLLATKDATSRESTTSLGD